jgi:small subunit ribosomal protein S18
MKPGMFGAKGPKGAKGKFVRKKRQKRQEAPKPCRFTKDDVFQVDYRDISGLQRLVSSQGKIQSRRRNSVSAFYQRQVQLAVKRARFLALLPYVGE